MSRKALAKNVDPAVTGLLEAVEKDLLGSMEEYKALFAEQRKSANQMAKDIASLQKHADSTESSIAAVEMKAKNLIDKSLSSQSTTDTSWKDEVSVLAGELVARVEGFERRMDDLEHKLTRYFDKEKYAITKGIITQIINEEKANG
tara:strand:+ start:459 stop:896 length:438 start_codon:yes stop_codon:yes gene_type:complete